jgi:hypothetical protein
MVLVGSLGGSGVIGVVGGCEYVKVWRIVTLVMVRIL